MLWPSSMSQSLWAGLSMFWTLQYVRAKDFLNAKINDDVSPEKAVTSPHVDLPNMTKTPQEQGPAMQNGSAEPQQAKAKPVESANAGSVTPEAASKGGRSESSILLRTLPAVKRAQGDLGTVSRVFQRTLQRTWQPNQSIPRGAFIISGQVEIAGPKARLVLGTVVTHHPGNGKTTFHTVTPLRIRSNVVRPGKGPPPKK